MSDMMQVADTNIRKRKASDSLMNNDEVLVDRSNDSDSDMDEDLIIFDMMLAGNSCFSDSDVDEDYTDKKTQNTFPVKKRKMIHGQSEVITVDDAPSLDTLPMELLQQIIWQLDYKSVLCTKFSSRRLYSACGNSEGTGLPRPWPFWPWNSRRAIRAQAFFHFEVDCKSPNKSGKLTCSICWRSFGNNATGFADEHFKQHLATRTCIKCLIRTKQTRDTLTVCQTTKLRWCRKCHHFKPFDAAAMKADLENFYDSLWLPHLAAISKDVRRLDKQRITESTVMCRDCIENASLAHQSAMVKCEQALSAMLEHTYECDSTMRLMPGLKAKRLGNRFNVVKAMTSLAQAGRDRKV